METDVLEIIIKAEIHKLKIISVEDIWSRLNNEL